MFSARVHGWWPWSDISITRSSGPVRSSRAPSSRSSSRYTLRTRSATSPPATSACRGCPGCRTRAGSAASGRETRTPCRRHPTAARPLSRFMRCGAALGDALDVGQQVERPVAEGRPGAAVDRPAECGADLGRMAEGAALRDHAAGDGDADDLGAADRSAARSPAASSGWRPTGAAARWARGWIATRPASAGSPGGTRGCRRLRARPGRGRSETWARPPRSGRAGRSGTRPGCRGRSARRGGGGRPARAASRISQSAPSQPTMSVRVATGGMLPVARAVVRRVALAYFHTAAV